MWCFVSKIEKEWKNFLLAGDKFMSEIHLRQPILTWSVCGPFTKIKERIENLNKTGDSQYLYQNKLEEACFWYFMAYGDFKDLPIRTTFTIIIR